MSDEIINVSDASFTQDVLAASGAVLVDFWAPWCGPCKMIAPMLEDVAKEYAGKVTIAKINIDDNPNTPRQFGVRSIPTLVLFKDGEVVDTKVGALPKAQLAAFLDSAVG